MTRRVLTAHLGDFDTLWFWVVLVGAADQCAEEDVELLATLAGDRTANRPDHTEQEQALQPQGDLKRKQQIFNFKVSNLVFEYHTLFSTFNVSFVLKELLYMKNIEREKQKSTK